MRLKLVGISRSDGFERLFCVASHRINNHASQFVATRERDFFLSCTLFIFYVLFYLQRVWRLMKMIFSLTAAAYLHAKCIWWNSWKWPETVEEEVFMALYYTGDKLHFFCHSLERGVSFPMHILSSTAIYMRAFPMQFIFLQPLGSSQPATCICNRFIYFRTAAKRRKKN